MSDTQKEKSNTTYANVSITEQPGSQIEITGEATVEIVHAKRSAAIKKIQKNLELPGFRKGHVPEDMVISHTGEQQLMQEAAELVLGDVYADIVRDNKLDVVGRPEVTITKLAPGNPIGFKIVSAVYPKVELPDYKKLTEEVRKKSDDPEKEVIDEKDIASELERLQGMMAGPAEKGEDGKEKKKELPALDDDFAKKLGAFDSLDDLKDKMSKQMLMDKKQKATEKIRLAMVDAVLGKTKMEVPEVFVKGELDQMVASFEERVQRAGMEMEGYLKQAEKTVEDLRKEWTPDAEKRAKMQIVFNEIAQKEKISPDPDKLIREVAHIKEHYPDADEQAVRVYAASQMTNDLVFAFFEGKEPAEVAKTLGHDHDHGHEHTAEEKKD